jgi:hypothetical protein
MTKFSTDFHSLLADLVGAQHVAVVTGILENVSEPLLALGVVLKYLWSVEESNNPHYFSAYRSQIVASLGEVSEDNSWGWYITTDDKYDATLLYDEVAAEYQIRSIASYW